MTEQLEAVKQSEENTLSQVQDNKDELSLDSAVVSSFTAKTKNEKTMESETRSMYVVFDSGASKTRDMVLYPGQPISKKNLSITDSNYAIIDMEEDLAVYKKSSNDLEDNGEYIVTELADSPNIETSWFAEPVRFLKGNLMSKLSKVADSITNQFDKTNDIGIFINMIATLANNAYKHGSTSINAHVAFLLPPKERYSDTARIELIKKTLAGDYEIQMPRFGFKCNLKILEENIAIEAEGETAFIYYTTIGKGARERYEEYKDKKVIINDLGASTFNLALMDDGSIKSGISHTSKYGGNNLVSTTYSILSRMLSIPIDLEQAQRAVETGYVQSGTQKIPVGKYLTKAKVEIANKLFREYVSFLGIAALHATSIYANIFVGRGMMQTGTIDASDPDNIIVSDNFSPSIGQLLCERYSELSPDTKGLIVQDPGLANLYGVASLMKHQWKL